jgi:hypothetical protein
MIGANDDDDDGNDASGGSVPPASWRASFHVTARLGRANAFGRLSVSPGELTFDPGPFARFTHVPLRVSGSLVHRDIRVVIVTSRLSRSKHLLLCARAPDDALTRSRWFRRRAGSRKFAALTIPRRRRTRVVADIERAGFTIEMRRRWLYFGLRPFD